ncbi:MAG: flagellar biosynthetic protein FliO, partial [Desulfovibrionaceae bacterium]|nr:flagellar biosynthetic protein FliO [Desulfovibrionaceae bacterium]
MFLLLGALWFAAWIYRKRRGIPGSPLFAGGGMRLEAALPLGGRRSLVLVRFLNSRYLLGVTDQ